MKIKNVIFLFSVFGLFAACQKQAPSELVNIDELPLSTAVDISSSHNISGLLENVALRATLAPKKIINAQYPTGTITFYEEDSILCVKTLATPSLSATCEVSFSKKGAHNIFAFYSGDNYYQQSKSTVYIQNVPNAVQTDLTLHPLSETNISIGSSTTLIAELKRNLIGLPIAGAVEFTDGTNSICVIALTSESDLSNISCVFTPKNSGIYYVSARYLGDDSHDASQSKTRELIVNKLITSIELITSADTSLIGDEISLFAKLIPISQPFPIKGTLSFTENGKAISACTALSHSAQCKIKIETLGKHTFTVMFSGDENYFGSTSAPQNIYVTPRSGTINLTTEGEWIRSKTLKIIASTFSPLSSLNGKLVFHNNDRPITSCANISWRGSKNLYTAECSVKITSDGPQTFGVSYSDDQNNDLKPAQISGHVLIPTKATLSRNIDYRTSREINLYATLSVADKLENRAISGYAEFFVDGQRIESCKNIHVVNSQVPDCKVNYTNPATHVFEVRYEDKNQPKTFASTFAQIEISIDTPIPNSPIYSLAESGRVVLSTNGGRSWAQLPNQHTDQLNKALSFAVTPTGGIYVGTSQGDVYFSLNQGESWQQMPKPNFGEPVIALSITPHQEILVGYNQQNNGILKKYIPQDTQTIGEWVSIAEETFINRPISQMITFAPQQNTKQEETRIIVSHKNGELSCRIAETDWPRNIQAHWVVNNPVIKDSITALYIGTDGFGRKLFFGTSAGKIYKDNTNLDDVPSLLAEYCPNTGSIQELSIPSQMNGSINGLFITSTGAIFDDRSADKFVQNFSTIYALSHNKLFISKDAGANWDIRSTADNGIGKNLSISPILYAVAGGSLNNQKDIQISQDNGLSWYTIQSGLSGIKKPYLGAFFVTPQNGFLFTRDHTINPNNSHSHELMTSLNGGKTWQLLPIDYTSLPIEDSEVTALWVEFVNGNTDFDNLRSLTGYANGTMYVMYFPFIRRIWEPKNPVLMPIISSIQPAKKKDDFQYGYYPNSNTLEYYYSFYDPVKKNDLWGTKFQITLDNWKQPSGEIPGDSSSVHAFTVNQGLDSGYISLRLSPVKNAIYKSYVMSPAMRWSIPTLVNFGTDMNKIPISLFTTHDDTLYASFVKTTATNAEKDAQLSVTQDGGLRWLPFVTQPYRGTQGTSTIFAQYQYN